MSSHTYLFDLDSMECFDLGNYASFALGRAGIDLGNTYQFDTVFDKALLESIYYEFTVSWAGDEQERLDWIDELTDKIMKWGTGRQVEIHSEYYETDKLTLASFHEVGTIYRDN